MSPSGGGNRYIPSGGGFWTAVAASQPNVAVAVTALAGVAVFAALLYTTNRGHLKSPWFRRRRKHVLSAQQWKSLFTPDGKLQDGVKFLKIVRSGGVDPSIRTEVWPFLLGVYDLNSTKEERDVSITQKRTEYRKLRRQCQRLIKRKEKRSSNCLDEEIAPPSSEGADYARESLSIEEKNPDIEYSDEPSIGLLDNGDDDSKENANADGSLVDTEYSDEPSIGLLDNGDDDSKEIVNADGSLLDTESSDSESSEDPVVIQASPASEGQENVHSGKPGVELKECTLEDFGTWQRIIRLDAVRANPEWIPFCPSEAGVSAGKAHQLAEGVGLKDYDHLEPCRIFHAARLVAILEAYALYDPEIGYCQGMSDLLSPIITVITEDHVAFWCFVGFMKKARDNFRLDEVGIRRQLNIVSKIIRCKDGHLFRHLEMLQAEDCFFVYRMVVVLFRRELTFEQTMCLWEVMWADQAAIRAGLGKTGWRMRVPPPTEDLLLYAIAASVLQKRKLIIEKYSSMDEILRECNSMAGQLDVWKLLDDAHNLVVNLHHMVE